MVLRDLTEMSYEYIELNGNMYVPRMPSMCDARIRNDLFLKLKGTEPLIVGPREWELLSFISEIKILKD